MRKTSKLPNGFQGTGTPVTRANTAPTGRSTNNARTAPSDPRNLKNTWIPEDASRNELPTPAPTRTKRVLKKSNDSGLGDPAKVNEAPAGRTRVSVRQRRLNAGEKLPSPSRTTSRAQKSQLLVKSDPVELPAHPGSEDEPLFSPLSADRSLRKEREKVSFDEPKVLIEEIPDKKRAKAKLSRLPSTKEFLRSFKKKAEDKPGREKETRPGGARPKVSLFSRNKTRSNKVKPQAVASIEIAPPAKSTTPARLAGPFRPAHPEQIDCKVNSMFALTIYSDPAYAGAGPALSHFLEKNHVGEVAHFQRDLAKYSPTKPPTQMEATALFGKYIEPGSIEQLNLLGPVVQSIEALLLTEPFDATAFYNALTMPRGARGGEALQSNLFESSREHLLDFPTYYATLTIAPPGFGQSDIDQCMHWMQEIYSDARYAHLREALSAHMKDPRVGAPEVIDFLQAIAGFSAQNLPSPEQARRLYDQFISPEQTGTSMLFFDGDGGLNLTHKLKEAARAAIEENNMEAFWAIVIGQPGQPSDDDADAILPQLSAGIRTHYASFLEKLESTQ